LVKALFVAVLTIAVVHQPPSAAVLAGQVPRAVVRAATYGTPADFAAALAEADLSAGFIVEDDRAKSDGDYSAAPRSSDRSTLGEAIAAFTRYHSGHRVTQRDDVLIVETERPTICHDALTRPVTNVRLEGTLHHVLDGAFRAGNPAHPPFPPGLLGGPALELPRVQVAIASGPFRDVLNVLAGQVRGFVWVMHLPRPTETGERRCGFDYYYRGTGFSTGWRLPLKH